MYVSTPTGLYQSNPHNITHTKIKEQKKRIPTSDVDEKIPGWLAGIVVKSELIPNLLGIYKKQIKQITQDDKEEILV